ncbi:DUF4179 domain-containing protein [Brevibacillus borstelensis]|uniref:DUF4179 domain-containing protein n=1 Tax=Brevibacillus borstelensis TaxID=45462 RepID=UPI0030C49AFC
MKEDRVWREFAESAKQELRQKYPFRLSELEAKVMDKVQKRTRLHLWKRTALLAGAAVSCALVFAMWNPLRLGGLFEKNSSVQSTAKFEWQTPDEGFIYALNNGYPILPSVKKEQNDYTVEVKDAMVDQRRIVYTMLISGEKIEEIAREKDKEKKADLIYRELSTNVGELGTTGGISTEWKQIDGSHYLIYKARFIVDDMDTILKQANPVLPVQFVKQSHNGDDVLVEVPLTLPEEVVSAKKSIQPTATDRPQLGKQDLLRELIVKEIELTPTLMRVQVQAKTKDGFELQSLSNPRLVDDQGKEYNPIPENKYSPLRRYGHTAEYFYLDMIPSLYFGSGPKELALKFDGALVSTLKTGSFTLERNGKFPMKAPFGNKSSQILQVYYKNQKLHVVLPGELLTEETRLKVDGVDYDDEVFQDGAFIRTYPVPQKDVYQVETQRNDVQKIDMDGLVPIIGGK